MKRILDISTWQTSREMDYAKIAKNVDGVIIRIGYTGWGTGKNQYLDDEFFNHYNNFKKLGVPIGIYFMAVGMDANVARQEAYFVLDLIKAHKLQLSYPIYIDSEHSGSDNGIGHQSLNRRQLTDVCLAFMKTIEANGYKAGIYASTSWFDYNLYDEELLNYSHWVADYRGYNGYKKTTDIWQYTGSGRLPGYSGDLDLNCQYKEFGTAKKSIVTRVVSKVLSKADITKMARDVLLGKYGNGDERKRKLGSNYNAVQDEVNRIIEKRRNIEIVAKEVIQGLWGNGRTRADLLKANGYSYEEVQDEVNNILYGGQ